jgi:uncharacterized phage protein (TIGR02218 family)
MRILPTALAAHVATSATTLCRCWKLTRRDGSVLGYTDHDRTLSFEGVEYRAGSGLAPSETEAATGLQVGGGEVSGVLSADDISEVDILAGRYDGASVAVHVVNWADVSQRLLLDVFDIGEIRRSDKAFVAELRNAMHRLDQEQGRLFQRTCSAALGDARCKVALGPHTAAVAVTSSDSPFGFHAAGLVGAADGAYAGGVATFTSGANAGQRLEIRASDGNGDIALWSAPSNPISVGDGVTLVAGCDKSFATCQAKFANVLNFRGFPHIPSPDFVLAYARSGEGGHDGGLLET